jgi:hypothetical protein
VGDVPQALIIGAFIAANASAASERTAASEPPNRGA